MDQPYKPRGFRGSYLIDLLILLVVAERGSVLYWERPNFIPFVLLLGSFTVLYLLERNFSDRLHWYRFLYFPTQAILVWALGSLRPFLDVFNLLFIVLSLQAIQTFSYRVAVSWAVFYAILLATTTVLGLGWLDGIVLGLSYLAGLFFVVSYDVLYVRAHSDEAESQSMLAELHQAHQELQEYAAQGEELAAARERNRLARQLHDSVSQGVFSITLTAQSARLLLHSDHRQVPELLDRLQEMTAGALSQLRSLIGQLRPPQSF